jgi:hypothetical protein
MRDEDGIVDRQKKRLDREQQREKLTKKAT